MKKIIFLLVLLIFPTVVFADDLPTLNIIGYINDMTTKADVRTVEFDYSDGINNYNGYAKLKIQGSSSTYWPKKNFNITFYKDVALSKKNKIDVKWGKQSKYTLKANYIDTKTYARNIVTANIVADIHRQYNILDQAPNNGLIDGFPIIINNNGEFYGIYTLNIPKDDWLFNMDDKNDNHIAFSCNDWGDQATFYEPASNSDTWEIEVGNESQDTYDKLNRVINFVINSTDQEFKNNINDYFNFDSLLTYYVMSQYSHLHDNMAKNMLLTTYDGQIWYTVLYDLDTSWGTDWDDSGDLIYKYGQDVYKSIVNLDMNNLWRRFKNNFSNEIADRYFELRTSILTKGNILNKFNNFYNRIPSTAIQLEFNKWGAPHGEYISQIESFLNIRESAMDDYFNSFYSYIPMTGISINGLDELKPYTSNKVDINYYPSNTNADKTVTWTSSNDDIATVDSNGVVSAISSGEVTICATSTFRFRSCKNILVKSTDNYVSDIGLKNSNNIIHGFNVGLDLTELRVRFNDKYSIESSLNKISTGAKLIINGDEMYAVVYGDLNGDGDIDSGDLLRMRQHLLGTSPLDGAYREAGKVIHGDDIDSSDLLRLKQYLLGTNNIEQ